MENITIEEVYELVGGLPKMVNLITEQDTHPWIGYYKDMPDQFKNMIFKHAYIKEFKNDVCMVFQLKGDYDGNRD